MEHVEKNNKTTLICRLKIVEGQVRGLQKLIAKDRYCIDVITQTSAVKRALSIIEDLLLANHLETCAMHQMTHGQVEKAKKRY